MSRRLTTEEFIEKAKKVHGDKYDYSKVNYINNYTKVSIICPEHGEFEQRPENHLQGQCCPKCSNILKKLTIGQFIEKAIIKHGNKYDYSKVNYINNYTKVSIICPEHGEFRQTPLVHLRGHGCPKCKGVFNPSTEEFIEKAKKVHGDKYDYSKVNYINNYTKVSIICPEHGEFRQTPLIHLRGHGCPVCSATSIEKFIWKFLNDLNISFEFQKKFNGLRYKAPLFFDFYLPDHNMCVEYDGEQHFKRIKCWHPLETYQLRDSIKDQYCKDNNIKLLRISYEDQDKIEEILKKELGLS